MPRPQPFATQLKTPIAMGGAGGHGRTTRLCTGLSSAKGTAPGAEQGTAGGRCAHPGEGSLRGTAPVGVPRPGGGRSYLGTVRCRRVCARGPRPRLGRSTRARRRRPGFCSCCGPRRLREGGRAVSVETAGSRRAPLPPRPPDSPAGSAAPGPPRTASQLRHGAPPEASRRFPR